MSPGPPNAFSLLAAATTPVVAAAIVLVALVATGCEARAPTPPPVASQGTSVPAAPPTPGEPTQVPFRLLVITSGPGGTRLLLRDPDRLAVDAVSLGLPADATPVAALAVSPGGRLAAVTTDGRAWVARPVAGDLDGPPAWQPLPVEIPRPGLPGVVLGATWSRDGDALLLLAGAPGSGTKRTVLAAVPLGGRPASLVEIPLEADGPGIAALPDGQTAFVVRDPRDRGALARLAPAGSFVTLPVAARAVAAGGDLFAIVGDAEIRVGTLDELRRGVLPAMPLPLEGGSGVGNVAIAPDGRAVAIVRLDDAGDPARIEVLRLATRGWEGAGAVPLEPGTGAVLMAWLP